MLSIYHTITCHNVEKNCCWSTFSLSGVEKQPRSVRWRRDSNVSFRQNRRKNNNATLARIKSLLKKKEWKCAQYATHIALRFTFQSWQWLNSIPITSVKIMWVNGGNRENEEMERRDLSASQESYSSKKTYLER